MTTKPSYRALKMGLHKLRALDNPVRKRIIRFLDQGSNDVSHIMWHLREEQSVTSQHLAILHRAGFVTREQAGKHVIYSLNYYEIDRVSEICSELAQGAEGQSPVRRSYERSIY